MENTKNSLINAMYKETSKGLTENGAVTYKRTGSACLDFFSQAGAMRKNVSKAVELFSKAYSEDRQTAIRILFYLRDVRGGQGERLLFRKCLEVLNEYNDDVLSYIIPFIPEYGRFDDMFIDNFFCYTFLRKQLESDYKSDNPSLLAKWLPTINASSKNTRNKANIMAKGLGLRTSQYRKLLVLLRKKINIVESKMSARRWRDIEYSKVPSQASRIYKGAFKKHDEDRYTKFIESAIKGKAKINTSTLYPYQIYNSVKSNYSKTLEALWNQLPDYTQGKNALVVADVSGSMRGNPMSVSVSLALYFAERNTGQFKDYFLTFSNDPVLQKISGKTLQDKMDNLECADWGMNTNLQKVFDLILSTSVANKVSVDEMPETIYVISDMEFDACASLTNYESIKNKYQDSGYKLPNIVFWNVDASGSNLPVQKDEIGVSLVSGFSPSIFKMAVENKTPEQLMMSVVDSDRYNKIIINTSEF